MAGGASAFDKAPIDCFSMWTVHSYEGDYNPLHDHDVSYDQKCMAFSIILYCLVPTYQSKAFIPGSSFPSRYSRNAPPAVETKLKLSIFPTLFITAIVSPPPTTE